MVFHGNNQFNNGLLDSNYVAPFGNNNASNCNCNGQGDNGCSGVNNASFQTNTLGASSTDDNLTRDTLNRNLANYIGRRVSCEFNICNTNIKKTGVLSCVGRDFITLTGNNGSCLLCDTNSLNFVTICS